MLMQIRFGAKDTPACFECKKGMRITRRTPHPLLGNEFELQTFTCWNCQLTFERTADRQGEVATYGRSPARSHDMTPPKAPLPPETTNTEDHESMERARPAAADDQWLPDFIRHLNYTMRPD